MTSTGALAQYQYPEKGLGLRLSSANQRKIQIDRQGIVCRGRPRLATGLAITAAHKKGAPACLNEALRLGNRQGDSDAASFLSASSADVTGRRHTGGLWPDRRQLHRMSERVK